MNHQITSSLSTDSFKDISKDTFLKYKKVRKLHTPLLGDHYLFSKNGVKYLVKQLSTDQEFFTTRPCGSVFYHKYTAPKSMITSYIYPILGIGLDSVINYANTVKQSSASKQSISSSLGTTQAAKQYTNLLSRHCSSLQKVLLHVLKYLIQLILTSRQQQYLIDSSNCQQQSSNSKLLSSFSKSSMNKSYQSTNHHSSISLPHVLNIPILLQCMYVNNGELFYCYDSWMNNQTKIIVSDIRQIQNLFLQNQQLKSIQTIYLKQMKRNCTLLQQKQLSTIKEEQTITFAHQQSQSKQQSNKLNIKAQPEYYIEQISLFSALYKAFLLVLHLGSMEMNLRLYEWGQFKLSYQNLQKRIHHFKLRYNNTKQKLGNLLQRVLLSKKQGHQQVKISDILSILNNNQKQSDLASNNSRIQCQTTGIKAPKRVTLSKKNKIQNFDNVSVCQSVLKGQRQSIGSNSQFNCLNSNAYRASEFKQSLNSSQSKQINSNHVSKNRTLSNMVLRECNSLQYFDKQQILIRNQDDEVVQNDTKIKQQERKRILTSIKKDKQNKRVHTTFSNSKSTQNVKTVLFSSSTKNSIKPSLVKAFNHQFIAAFQAISSTCIQSNIPLTKAFGLQYLQSNSKQQQIILNRLSQINTNQNWVKKYYEDKSFYFGQVINVNQPLTEIHQNQLENKIKQNEDFKRNGFGIYIFPSKDIYIGNWISNLIHGYGIYIFQSGEIYIGELSQGCKEGYGTFYYADGRKYQGFWKNDKKIGLGTIYFLSLKQPNSLVKFIGQFKQYKNDSQVEGFFTGYDKSLKIWSKQGVLNSFDPLQFEFKAKKHRFSNFTNNKNEKIFNCSVSKYREFIDQIGTKYAGQVTENKKNGFGTQQTGDSYFEGNFIDDQRNGYGKLVTKDLLTIQGKWKNGIMIEYTMS